MRHQNFLILHICWLPKSHAACGIHVPHKHCYTWNSSNCTQWPPQDFALCSTSEIDWKTGQRAKSLIRLSNITESQSKLESPRCAHQQTKRSPAKVLVPDTTWILTKYRAVRIRWCTWISLNVCFWVWLKLSTAVSRLKRSLVEQQTSRLLLKYAQPTQLQ